MKDNEQRIGQEEPLPNIQTMQPVLKEHTPLDIGEWCVEKKLDGIRALAFIDRATGHYRIKTRGSAKAVATQFPEFRDGFAVLTADRRLILDGEIIFGEGLRGQRQTPITRLGMKPPETRQGLAVVQCTYAVFDLLYLDDENLLHRPLSQRKALLDELLPQDFQDMSGIRVNPYWDGLQVAKVMEDAYKEGYEGLVFKRKQSHYQQRLSQEWWKLKFPESSRQRAALAKSPSNRPPTHTRLR